MFNRLRNLLDQPGRYHETLALIDQIERSHTELTSQVVRAVENQAALATRTDPRRFAPWLSCAHLQQALHSALDMNGAEPALRAAARDLLDVDPNQYRSTDELADLRARGLIP